jgi:hypothetical protein
MDYADALHFFSDLIEYHKDESQHTALFLHMRVTTRCKQYLELNKAGLVRGLGVDAAHNFVQNGAISDDFLSGVKKMALTELGQRYMAAYSDYLKLTGASD